MWQIVVEGGKALTGGHGLITWRKREPCHNHGPKYESTFGNEEIHRTAKWFHAMPGAVPYFSCGYWGSEVRALC